MIQNASPAELAVEIFEDDVAFLMYTSGTTGLPKGVMQTHGNLVHAGRVCSRANEITMDDRTFIVCPMYHITAYYNIFGGFYVACPAYIFTKWDVDLFLSSTEKFKLTCGMLATPMVMMVLDSPNYAKYDLSSWKSLWFAGAGIIPETFKKFVDTFGLILGEHTTERPKIPALPAICPGETSRTLLERGDTAIYESCGRSGWDMEVLIVDENGKQVPPGVPGEMIVRGPRQQSRLLEKGGGNQEGLPGRVVPHGRRLYG